MNKKTVSGSKKSTAAVLAALSLAGISAFLKLIAKDGKHEEHEPFVPKQKK